MSGWGAHVFEHPLLRGLDARARGEIELAGAVRELAAGARLFGAGDPADALFVVDRGTFSLRARRRGEEVPEEIRRAGAGDALGEDAVARSFGARRAEATCLEAGAVWVIPAPILRRALERLGRDEAALRRERIARRAALGDVLRTVAFARDLPAADLEALLDVAESRELRRGEVLWREGERANAVAFVADGSVQLQREEGERVRVVAYLGAGDMLGDEDALAGTARSLAAVAAGEAWVVQVPARAFAPVAARHPEVAERARRVRKDAMDVQRQLSARATRHVLGDLHRFETARSLLVIDQEACVRCGHCSAACGAAHGDGISRLLRQGDTVRTHVSGAPVTLLLPSSCQHCQHPACMIDCPTGAIGRDEQGDVFIREDLCTGCGSCAKACPWENIAMAPLGVEGAQVAVKCDLCAGMEGGPACVASCPTQAIARIEPQRTLDDVRAALGDERAPVPLPARAAAWPHVAAAAVAALSVGWAGRAWPKTLTGLLALACVVALVAYAVLKRRGGRAAAPAPRASRVRAHFIAHLALGALCLGFVAAHAGMRYRADLAGALAIAFWTTGSLGVLAAAAYALAPRVLARLERFVRMPEDLADHARDLDARVFRGLTGRSDAVKVIYARVLVPYRKGPASALRLLCGARLGDEERRLRARIDGMLGADRTGGERLAGLEELIRLVVEQRALPLVRWLNRALRGLSGAHAALTVATVILLAAHVLVALRYR